MAATASGSVDVADRPWGTRHAPCRSPTTTARVAIARPLTPSPGCDRPADDRLVAAGDGDDQELLADLVPVDEHDHIRGDDLRRAGGHLVVHRRRCRGSSRGPCANVVKRSRSAARSVSFWRSRPRASAADRRSATICIVAKSSSSRRWSPLVSTFRMPSSSPSLSSGMLISLTMSGSADEEVRVASRIHQEHWLARPHDPPQDPPVRRHGVDRELVVALGAELERRRRPRRRPTGSGSRTSCSRRPITPSSVSRGRALAGEQAADGFDRGELPSAPSVTRRFARRSRALERSRLATTRRLPIATTTAAIATALTSWRANVSSVGRASGAQDQAHARRSRRASGPGRRSPPRGPRRAPRGR